MKALRFKFFAAIILTFALMTSCQKTQQNNGLRDGKVYEGAIDLKAIDDNNDGKLFQCPMDYNALSDAPSKCPICKMDLEKTSIGEAKKVLEKNNFEVK